MKSPNAARNCDQLVTGVGLLNSPFSAKPTKAATAVPTPSMGLLALSISSTYTPGDRYVVATRLSLLRNDLLLAGRLARLLPAE